MKIDKNGLQSTIKELNAYLNVAKNSDEVLNTLCEIGKQEVELAHQGTMGVDRNADGTQIEIKSDIEVTIEKDATSHSIVATGEKFPFYEFGAGVAKNSPRDWTNDLGIPVPSGINAIGQYGKGQGSGPLWQYDGVITSGYAARHGFANAINKIVAELPRVIKGAKNG